MNNSNSNSQHQSIVAIGLTLLSITYVLFQNKRISDQLKNKVVEYRRKKKVGSVNIGGVFGMDVGGTLTKIVYFEPRSRSDQVLKEEEAIVNMESSNYNKLGNRSNDTMLTSPLNQLAPTAATDMTLTGEPPTKMIGLIRGNSSDSLAQLDLPDHQAALEELYTFMDNSKALQSTNNTSMVIRDDLLSVYSTFLKGKLHFIHFETKNMVTAIKHLSSSALVENIRTIGCTGGGAHKFAGEFEEELEITFDKCDELVCLVRGMHFALNNFEDECFTYRKSDVSSPTSAPISPSSSSSPTRLHRHTAAESPLTQPTKHMADSVHDSKYEQSILHQDQRQIGNKTIPVVVPSSSSSSSSMKGLQQQQESLSDKQWRKDTKEYTKRVTLHQSCTLSSFPYLVVNIGSGVSILKVTGPGKAERVSGTSLGGGTYWGLCRLLTGCESFEEVLNCAEQGDASVVDMLVRDIYGGDYTGSLTGGMVASSFGKLVSKEKPREGVKEEDLALALLMMITNNIGQVAYLTAQLQKCSQIYFVGNFLRHNPISCRRLAFAIDFWSGSKMEALFLIHEGYFGALGTFLTSAFKDDVDKIISINTLQSHKPSTDALTSAAATLYVNSSSSSNSINNHSDNINKDKDSTQEILRDRGSNISGGVVGVRAKSVPLSTSRLHRGRSFSDDSYNIANSKTLYTTTQNIERDSSSAEKKKK